MEITLLNIDRIFNDLENINPNTVYDIDLDCIFDAGLNPREIDILYAEEFSLTIPPIIVGIIKDSEIKKFAIIDGNHRFYNRSKVEMTKNIPAFIRVYENEQEAFIDSYKANLLHGRKLSDKDELKGMQRIIEYFKKEDPEIGAKKISDKINMPLQRVSEYLDWIKVNKVLGKEIVKWKAQKIASLLRKDTSGEMLKQFWSLNSNLSKPDLLKALKLSKNENKVVDYKTVKIKEILESDSLEDGLRIKKDEKISAISEEIKMDSIVKKEFTEEKAIDIDTDEDHNRFDNLEDDCDIDLDEDIKETDKTEEKYQNNSYVKAEKLEENDEKEIEDDNDYFYSEDEEIPEQNITLTKNKKNDLVALEGYNRFYKIQTIAMRYLDNMMEELLTNSDELKKLINTNINEENRDTLDNLKPEMKGMLKNMQLIIKDLYDFLSK